MSGERSFCLCPRFSLWYIDEDEPPPIRVCTCGHPDSEHLIGTRSCLGEVIISPGRDSVLRGEGMTGDRNED